MLENIPKLRRKEKSVYKPSDLWTHQDDLLFLRYCPSKRDRCYHAISRDLSCRPHEILKLKIEDLSFKFVGSSQYVEVVVNGKTGTIPIPIINSVPYLKDYLDHEHPQPRNPNAPTKKTKKNYYNTIVIRSSLQDIMCSQLRCIVEVRVKFMIFYQLLKIRQFQKYLVTNL